MKNTKPATEDKMNLSQRLTKGALTLGTLLLISACVDINSNNKDQKESSSVEEIGNIAFSNIKNVNGLTQTLNASGAPTLSSSSGLMKTAVPRRSLAKMAAEGVNETVVVDSSDMEQKGEITVTITNKEVNKESVVELRIKCQSNANTCAQSPTNIVYLKSSTTNTLTGKNENLEITDLDGDGIVNGEAQYSNKAKVIIKSTYQFLGSEFEESTHIEVTSGPDKDFGDKDKNPAAEKDNQILSMNWEKKRNGSLIESAEYKDADGDGYIVDPNTTSPSLVDLSLYESGKVFKPFVANSRLEIKIELAPENPKGRIVAMSAVENMKNGRVNRISIENTDGSGIIKPNSDVNITLSTDFPVNEDTLLNSEVRILLNVGSGLEDSTDNLLKEIHASHEAKIGPITKAQFDFIANPPVPHGQDPKGGTVNMMVDFRNGESFTVTGEFSPSSLTLNIKDSKGNTFKGTWNQDGEFIE